MFQTTICEGVSKRGNRFGSGPRKRGRPPGSSSGPRLPRSMSNFISYQAELLRHYQQQSAGQLSRQISAQSATPVGTPGAQPPTLTQSHSPVLKDRPSLSITPLKPTPTPPQPTGPTGSSPINKQMPNTTSPMSFSVAKKANPMYKARKQSSAPPLQTQWTPTSQPYRPSSLSIRPIPPMQPNIPKTSQELSLQHKILSAKKISSTAPSNTNTTLPSISTSSSFLQQPVSLSSSSYSILPNTIPKSQTSLLKTPSALSITPTPAVSITPASVPASPLTITPTTVMAPSHQSVIKKASDIPFHPSNELSYKQTSSKLKSDLPFHPSSELSVKQISTKQKSLYGSRPLTAAQRKEVVNSISIIPTTAKVDSPKNVPRTPPPHPLDEKARLASKMTNIDSSVADTLRNFGSSITITPTTKKPLIPPQDEMSFIPIQPTKSRTVQDMSEVIVLDD